MKKMISMTKNYLLKKANRQQISLKTNKIINEAGNRASRITGKKCVKKHFAQLNANYFKFHVK